MKRKIIEILSLVLLVSLIHLVSASQPGPGKAVIKIDVKNKGIRVSPVLYGIFFEEINLAGDGGLYGELVRNRSFEEPGGPKYWDEVKGDGGGGEIKIDSVGGINSVNVHCLELTSLGEGKYGVTNSGYYGIPVLEGSSYDLTFYAKCKSGSLGPISASLVDSLGKNWAMHPCRRLPARCSGHGVR